MSQSMKKSLGSMKDSTSGKKLFGRIMVYVAVIALLFVILAPYFWMVSCSFKKDLEIQSADIMRQGQEPSWMPRTPTLENYLKVNSTVNMLDYFKNSFIISTGSMILAVLVSLLAGYAVSRFNFKGKMAYQNTLFATQLFPGVAFIIPYFVLFNFAYRFLGIPMQNTFWGMIFTYTSFSLPYCVLMITNFLDKIPRDIDEQAQIDGCNKATALFKVIIPLATPGIAAIGIYAFIMGWNELLFASILTGQETKTVAIGLLEYITAQSARWGGMMAACVLVSIPVLVLFTAMQKQIVEGLVSGATKG